MQTTRSVIWIIVLGCSIVAALLSSLELSKEQDRLPYSVVTELVKNNLQKRMVSKVVLGHDDREASYLKAGEIQMKILFCGDSTFASVAVPEKDADEIIKAFTSSDVPVWAVES